MIVCPNCNHPNPEGAVQCEACYTPLPATVSCPSCGATVQADASFCGQCGYNLRSATAAPVAASAPTIAPDIPVELPPTVAPDPLSFTEPVVVTAPISPPEGLPPTTVSAPPPASMPTSEPKAPALDPNVVPPPTIVPTASPATSPPIAVEPEPEPVVAIPDPIPEISTQEEPEPEPAMEAPEAPPMAEAEAAPTPARTQLQQITAYLIHIQSDQQIELPQNLSVIHMGKPNDRIPPDIDVSGFSNSEIVSRSHADIRIEGDGYYIEDIGSSNGTYINNLPLLPGNRHRLRAGDRISLGKGDLVTFLFQTS